MYVCVAEKTVEVLGQDETIEVVKLTRQVLATGGMWAKVGVAPRPAAS